MDCIDSFLHENWDKLISIIIAIISFIYSYKANLKAKAALNQRFKANKTISSRKLWLKEFRNTANNYFTSAIMLRKLMDDNRKFNSKYFNKHFERYAKNQNKLYLLLNPNSNQDQKLREKIKFINNAMQDSSNFNAELCKNLDELSEMISIYAKDTWEMIKSESEIE